MVYNHIRGDEMHIKEFAKLTGVSVRTLTMSGRWKRLARPVAPSTNQSPPLMSSTRPTANNRTDTSITILLRVELSDLIAFVPIIMGIQWKYKREMEKCQPQVAGKEGERCFLCRCSGIPQPAPQRKTPFVLPRKNSGTNAQTNQAAVRSAAPSGFAQQTEKGIGRWARACSQISFQSLFHTDCRALKRGQ